MKKRGLIDKKVIFVLVFAIALISFASAAHPDYPAFAQASFTINNNVLSISDDIIYNTGYYSVNGGNWQSFQLQGQEYGNGHPFLINSATGNLNLPSTGTHYVIIFSCSLANNAWDCHENKWQLEVVDNVNTEVNNNNNYNPSSGDLEQADHYVAPNGNDNGPGTISNPWRTWEKAFTSDDVRPGDLVYFRGGVYNYETDSARGWRIEKDGAPGNVIRYWAYPGETPILDGSNFVQTTEFKAITTHSDYVHYKGLVIRNFIQRLAEEMSGFEANGRDVTFENCVFHDIGGHGLTIGNGYNFRVINCDAYNMLDTEWTTPGEQGSGFAHSNPFEAGTSSYFYGCRAWNCADQGFATNSAGYVEYDNCWSFDNGALQAGGSGFKLGGFRQPSSQVIRVVKNSIAANNRLAGFNTNDEAGSDTYSYSVGMNIHNNFVYHDGSGTGNIRGYSFYIRSPEGSVQEQSRRVFNNNIAYSPNGYASVFADGAYSHNLNSWDTSGITVNANDFLSLDINQLYRPRKPDGSLPDITFGKVRSDSDLRDSGVYTG